jgi:DNA-binding NtrC family response regulator
MSPRRSRPPALYTKAPFLQDVIDGMPDSVKIIDTRYRVVYANESAQKSLKRDLNDLRGRSCHQAFYGFAEKCFFCSMKSVFEEGESKISYCTMGVNGSDREFEVSVFPLRSAGQKVEYAVEIVKDVTCLARGSARTQLAGKVTSRDRAFSMVFEQLSQLADEAGPVLIQGEKGTGKKSVARALHQRGARADAPFRVFHCADHPQGDYGEALFNAWQKAGGGTLYLDEITQLGPDCQKLLADRLSMNQDPQDPRVVAATREDLLSLVQEGKLLGDLYNLFGARVIRLPALRNRKQDLPFLAHHFIETYKVLTGSPAEKLSPDAVCQLMTYAWPGNIRELETQIERACLLASGAEITQLDLPICAPTAERLGDLLEITEKAYLVDTLNKAQGNLIATARQAGLGLKTLQRKMRKYGLNGKDFRGLTEGAPEA